MTDTSPRCEKVARETKDKRRKTIAGNRRKALAKSRCKTLAPTKCKAVATTRGKSVAEPIRNFVATLACALEHIRMDAYAADLQAACALAVTHSRRSLSHALPTGGRGLALIGPPSRPILPIAP